MSAGQAGPVKPAAAIEREYAEIEREIETLFAPYHVIGNESAWEIHGPFGRVRERFGSDLIAAERLVRELSRAWHGGRLLRGECGRSPYDAGRAIPISSPMGRALAAVRAERYRQDTTWGEQNHQLSHWMLILGEEVGEAQKAVLELVVANRLRPEAVHLSCIGRVKDEIVQVAAVAVAILEFMDRREPNTEVRE